MNRTPEERADNIAAANTQANNIRDYWSKRGVAIRVDVVYIPGRAGRGEGRYSARVLDAIAGRPGLPR